MRELLEGYGVRFDRLGLYELASISLDWFSDEHKTNIEIELVKNGENEGYVFRVLLVPDAEGIVERTAVLASTLDAEARLGEMFVAKSVRENVIPDVEGLEFREPDNAYSIEDPDVFILTVRRLLGQLPTKESSYLGLI